LKPSDDEHFQRRTFLIQMGVGDLYGGEILSMADDAFNTNMLMVVGYCQLPKYLTITDFRTLLRHENIEN
jgi:hypothetical protein